METELVQLLIAAHRASFLPGLDDETEQALRSLLKLMPEVSEDQVSMLGTDLKFRGMLHIESSLDKFDSMGEMVAAGAALCDRGQAQYGSGKTWIAATTSYSMPPQPDLEKLVLKELSSHPRSKTSVTKKVQESDKTILYNQVCRALVSLESGGYIEPRSKGYYDAFHVTEKGFQRLYGGVDLASNG